MKGGSSWVVSHFETRHPETAWCGECRSCGSAEDRFDETPATILERERLGVKGD